MNDDIKKEIDRLEDIQLDNCLNKRLASVDKAHKRLDKLKKLQERNKKK